MGSGTDAAAGPCASALATPVAAAWPPPETGYRRELGAHSSRFSLHETWRGYFSCLVWAREAPNGGSRATFLRSVS